MKKNISILFVIVIGFISILFVGCKKASDVNMESVSYQDSFAVASPKMMKASGSVKSSARNVVSEVAVEESANISNNSSTNTRKLIRDGYLQIEVKDLASSEEVCKEWIDKNGGYISNSNSNERTLNITLRIPAKNFDAALNDLTLIGKVEEKNISSQDVTDRFYDLSTRLETRKILHKRLLSYLENAKTVEEMVSVERQINDVQSDIESMEGQLNRLTNQIDFCTLRINMHLPYNTTSQGYQWPSWTDNFKELFSEIINFFTTLIMVLIKIIIFGVPIVLICALLYWLTFGKLGLIKKLFKKLHK